MTQLCRKAHHLRVGCEGGALLEAALTLPTLFLLLFCFMQACLGIYSKSMISECAREGTRYAMYRGSTCPTSSNPTCQVTAAQVNTYVAGLGWPNLAGGTMVVVTKYPSGSQAPGSYVQVSVSYSMPLAMPFVGTGSWNLSAVSKALILQ